MTKCANPRAGLTGLIVLLSLLLAGCETAAPGMTYAQWQEEQAKKAQMEKAGVAYKSPAELRAEAAEMRKTSAESASKKPGN